MSFQEYVDHISQKYRLAVAISVIKTKPSNLSIDEYLTQLQNKIKNEKFDPNETVCSDDFNFDDDILKENEGNTQIEKNSYIINENRPDYSVNENDNEGSQTILNDFVFEDNAEGDTSIGDTLRLLKEVATITQKEDNANNLSQLTFCESQEAISNANNDVTHCYDATNAIDRNNLQNGNGNICMDSQETQLYTLYGFTQDYTHVSQTQNEYVVIADKYIRNKTNTYMKDKVDNVKDINGRNDVIATAVDERENIGDTNCVSKKAIENESVNTQSSQTLQNVNKQFTVNNVVNVEDINGRNDVIEIPVDGRENTGKINHAQRAIDNDCVNTKLIQSLQNVNKEFTVNDIYQDKTNGVNNVNDGIKNVNTQKSELSLNNISANKFTANTVDIAARKLNTGKCDDRFEMDTGINLKDTDIGNGTLFNNQNTVNDTRNEIRNIGTEYKDSKDRHEIKETTQNNQSSLNIEAEFNENVENDMEIDETASEENTQEIVPFKVIEEFNRVKSYVNKKDRRYDGYSTDSGYRSDSLRSSLKTSSQLHGAWLNQSAHCLINHILQTTATDDIVKQIAQVLGKLIDKLHEEENYPQFLEELLGTVDRMLLDMRVGGGWADNVIITKDENIQRLLLLNKSKHILKYTIDQTTTVLEEIHKKLTQDLYELTNAVEVENLCYIFHILETLLKRYMKVKDMSNQSTQNSQEEVTTRSSLTKLWRKKWYPDSDKEIIRNEVKICILKRCSQILNKIIVECMDGYSLVAFTALQCFNLIQD